MSKRFTQAQVDRALLKEQLILRLERGESLEAVSQDLGLAYHAKHVSRLRRRYIDGGRHWVALVDEREGRASTKITVQIAQWVIAELQHHPRATASFLRDRIERVFGVAVSDRHVRRLAHDVGREGRAGRPPRRDPAAVISTEPLILAQTPHAGIFFPTRGPVADGYFADDGVRLGAVPKTVSTPIPGWHIAALNESPRNSGQ